MGPSPGFAPLVYLDNMVISDLATGKLQSEAVTACCGVDKVLFTFSEYSIIEATNGTQPDCILARARMIDKLASAWIPDVIWQRDLAFVQFLTSDSEASLDVPVFGSLPELMRSDPRTPGLVVPNDYSAIHYARSKCSDKQDFSFLDQSFAVLEKVRRELRGVQELPLNAEINLHIARSVLKRYQIPVHDSGSLLVKVALGGKELLKRCAALEIEMLYSRFRTTEQLKNQTSNSVDFFHLSSALPVCDFFVTCDADVIRAAEYIRTKTQHKIARVIELVAGSR